MGTPKPIARRSILLAGAIASTALLAYACAPEHSHTAEAPDPRRPAINRHSRSIRDFGAVGDGKTDDQGAIQATINEVADRGGGSVLVPASNPGYACNRLTIPSGVALVGEGANARLIKRDPSKFWIVIAKEARNVVLRNIVIEARADVSTAMLRIDDGAKSIRIDQVTFECTANTHSTQVETRLDNSSIVITACGFKSGFIGIRVNRNVRDVLIEKSTFDGWIERGIFVLGTAKHAASLIAIRHNTIKPHGKGGQVRQPIQFNGSDSNTFKDVQVTDNVVTGAGTDYKDPKSPGTADLISLHRCERFYVARNICTLGGDMGITVSQQSRHGQVVDNTCEENDSSGLAIGSGTSSSTYDVVIERNVLMNNGLARYGKETPDWARSGITVHHANKILVADNDLGNSNQTGDQLYGVSVIDSGDDIAIESSNTFAGVKQASIYRR